MKIACLTPLLLSVATLSCAAEQSRTTSASTSEVSSLEKYLVVAAPIVGGTSVDSLGSKVTAISEEQLSNLNARDLQSALREVPGVVVSHFNPVGSFGGGEGGGVFIRGMGTARPGAEIQLSIDGIASYNSLWTHPILDMLSVDIAQRIDIYKGAQPVLYGNMAFAVVDITPKSQAASGQAGKVTLTGGSFGTWSVAAEAGFRKESLDTYVVASARASEGDRPNSEGRLLAGYLRLGWTFNKHWKAHLIYNGTSNYADDPGPDAALVPPAQLFGNGRFADDNDLLVATLSHSYAWGEGSLKPYWSTGKLNWTGQYNSATKLNENITVTEYINQGLKTREQFKVWEGGELLGGIDFDSISGKYRTVTGGVAGSFPETTVHISSPYASVSHRLELGNRWNLRPSIGVRYFDHSVFADEVAPQAGVVAGNGVYEVHVSGARGVNYPGLYVMSFPPGNNLHTQLSAETVDHWELGVSRQMGSLAKLELSVFRDDGKNRIVTSYPPFPPVWKNIAGFRSEGIEVSANVAPSRTVSFYGAVTALRSSPEDLPYAPDWSGSLGLNWRFTQPLHLSLDGQYVGERSVFSRNRDFKALNSAKLGSYVLLNARLAYDFELSAWNLLGNCFIAAENLGNTHYQQRAGYPMPGTNGSFGVSFKF